MISGEYYNWRLQTITFPFPANKRALSMIRKIGKNFPLIFLFSVDCELGSYNFEEARVDECFPCPFGHFGNRTGLTA